MESGRRYVGLGVLLLGEEEVAERSFAVCTKLGMYRHPSSGGAATRPRGGRLRHPLSGMSR